TGHPAVTGAGGAAGRAGVLSLLYLVVEWPARGAMPTSSGGHAYRHKAVSLGASSLALRTQRGHGTAPSPPGNRSDTRVGPGREEGGVCGWGGSGQRGLRM